MSNELAKLEEGVRRAHAAGDEQSVRVLASEIKRISGSTEKKSGAGFFGQAHGAMADILGAPADLVSAGLGAVHPSLGSDAPFLGSESIRSGMRAIGSPVAERGQTPQGFAERAGSITGGAAGALLPIGLGARGLAAGQKMMAKPAQRLLETVVRNPATVAGLEGASIAGAAYGGHAAESLDMPQGAQIAGELLGGIAAPMALGGGLTGKAVRMGRAGLDKLGVTTKKGATGVGAIAGGKRAAERLSRLVPDADEALRRLSDPSLEGLTPAQRIGSPEILAVERGVAERTATSRQSLDDRNVQNLQALRSEIEPVVSPDAARVFLEARRERVTDALQARTQQAAARAEQRIAEVSPELRRSESSRIMNDEIEKVYSGARQRESQLWNAIPTATIPTAPLRREFRGIIANVPKAQMDDVPKIAMDLLTPRGKFKGIENIKELQGLRSKLLEESRIARSTGNYNKARISDDIADAVLDAMGAAHGNTTGPVGAAMREALDYSRHVNQTFKQGVIGRVLGTDRTGAARIAPEMVSQALIGSGAERGLVGAQRAVGAADTPQMRRAVEETLRDSLEKTAIRNGELNPAAAERWLRQNRDTLDQYPELAEGVRQAVRAQNVAKGSAISERTIGSNLSNAQKSVTARYLNADVGKEMERVISSPNPAETARQLKQLVRQDPDAAAGLRAGAMEYVLRKSGSGQLDDLGVELISGEKLRKTLMDTKTRAALREIVGANGLKNLEAIAHRASLIERGMKVSANPRVMDDVVANILRIPAAVFGAQMGRKLSAWTGGGTLQAPSKMSSAFESFSNRLTRDRGEELLIQALNDDNLMKLLLQNTSTQAQKKEAVRKLNLWLASPAGKMFIEEEE